VKSWLGRADRKRRLLTFGESNRLLTQALRLPRRKRSGGLEFVRANYWVAAVSIGAAFAGAHFLLAVVVLDSGETYAIPAIASGLLLADALAAPVLGAAVLHRAITRLGRLGALPESSARLHFTIRRVFRWDPRDPAAMFWSGLVLMLATAGWTAYVIDTFREAPAALEMADYILTSVIVLATIAATSRIPLVCHFYSLLSDTDMDIRYLRYAPPSLTRMAIDAIKLASTVAAAYLIMGVVFFTFPVEVDASFVYAYMMLGATVVSLSFFVPQYYIHRLMRRYKEARLQDLLDSERLTPGRYVRANDELIKKLSRWRNTESYFHTMPEWPFRFPLLPALLTVPASLSPVALGIIELAVR